MTESRSQVVIKVCREEDVEALNTAIPTRRQLHLRRFRRQREHKSTYLLAWLGGIPVGHLDILWEGSDLESVREHLPDCPELNAIVVAPDYRSKGIGSQLIRAAEAMVKDRGFRKACIGVATDNPRAKKLYESLGYRDWGHGIVEESWTDVDEVGNEITVTGQDFILVNNLRKWQGQAPAQRA
jgi:GNAT superfamily N-acetyltransferase